MAETSETRLDHGMKGTSIVECVYTFLSYSVYTLASAFAKTNFDAHSLLHELVRAVPPLLEYFYWERVCQVLISRRVRMKVVAAVILWCQLTRYLRVPEHEIEIHNRIERPTLPNPVIDLHPRLLALGVRIRLSREVARRRERCDRCAKNRDPVCMDPGDYLFIRLDKLLVDDGLRGGRNIRRPNIVHPLEHHRIPHPRMS